MALALRRPLGPGPQRSGDPEGGAAPRRPARARVAAARGASAVGSLILAVARLVRLAAWIVALVIVAAIILRVTGANPANAIVRGLHDAGQWLVGPFKNIFTEKSQKTSIALNWGLAAVVYVIAGSLIARFMERAAPSSAGR